MYRSFTHENKRTFNVCTRIVIKFLVGLSIFIGHWKVFVNILSFRGYTYVHIYIYIYIYIYIALYFGEI